MERTMRLLERLAGEPPARCSHGPAQPACEDDAEAESNARTPPNASGLHTPRTAPGFEKLRVISSLLPLPRRSAPGVLRKGSSRAFFRVFQSPSLKRCFP